MTRWLKIYALCSLLPLSAQAGEMWGLDEEVLYRSPSYAMIETGRDESGAVDIYGALDLTLYNEHRANIYVSQNNREEAAEKPSRTYSLSFTSDPNATTSITLGAEQYKQALAIQIKTHHVSLNLRPGNWLLGIKREQRTLSAFRRNNSTVSIKGDGTVFTLAYDGFERWSLLASFRHNNYEYDLSTVLIQRRSALSPRSLDAASSLNKQQQNISLTHYFDSVYLTGSWRRYISAIDKSVYDYRSLRLAWQINNDWSAEMEGGGGKVEQGENSAYTSLALLYLW